MNGIIDVGGGQRAVFACGVFDYLMDNQIYLEYCMGVSAGAANCVSYVAKQDGRNLDFYTGYNLEPTAIGLLARRKTGSLIDLDYIYGAISNSTGKRPLDFEAYSSSSADFRCVATDAETGEAVYFRKADLTKDNYCAICASSCDPLVCKPYQFAGKLYFDGYVSDPIPVEKALEDGCEKIVLIGLASRRLIAFLCSAAAQSVHPAHATKATHGAHGAGAAAVGVETIVTGVHGIL